MKKYFRSTLWLIFIAAGTLFSECSKYLNLEPKNSTYDEVFWVNGANVQKAVSGAYSLLRDAFRKDRSYFIFGDVAADNFAVGSDFWNYTSLVQGGGFKFGYAPYLESSLWNWNRFYGIINQCHLIVENTAIIDKSKFEDGEAQQKRLEGEARFLRGYVYFYMQRVWGNVVLTKESFKDPQNIPVIPRASEDDVFAFIITDLQQAIDLLENTDDKSLASKGAAEALLAHVYAWRHDYVNAEKYCDEVISSGQYEMEDLSEYGNIWKGSSKESIFEVNMLFDAAANEATSDFFNVFLTDPYVHDKQLSKTWFLYKDMKEAIYDKPEGRVDSVFKLATGGTSFISIKYSGVNYYDPSNEKTYVISNNLVLLRLADIYLLRAEARSKNGNDGGALEDLTVVQERAQREAFTGSGGELFDEIFDERRRELIGEGHTQFDLIRMGQLQRLFPDQYSNLRIAQQGYYWPLNMRELLPQDPLLTQNEWWKSH